MHTTRKAYAINHAAGAAVRLGAGLLVTFVTVLASTNASALTPTPTISPNASPTPQRTGDLGTKTVQGRVYDASRGPIAGIGGATVHYGRSATFPPGMAGSVITDSTGAFSFVLFLHDTDTVVIDAVATQQGYFRRRLSYSGTRLWFATGVDFALPPGFCGGDCDEDGTVTIDELIVAVRVALGLQYNSCPAIDSDDDARASIDELVGAVRHALGGCPTVDAPMPCGDPDVTSRYQTCRATLDENGCVSAGGTWITYPYSHREGCLCRTGQAGCPCQRASDCLGECFAFDNGNLDCEGAEGMCSSEEPRAGCWCSFTDDGQAFRLCSDP